MRTFYSYPLFLLLILVLCGAYAVQTIWCRQSSKYPAWLQGITNRNGFSVPCFLLALPRSWHICQFLVYLELKRSSQQWQWEDTRSPPVSSLLLEQVGRNTLLQLHFNFSSFLTRSSPCHAIHLRFSLLGASASFSLWPVAHQVRESDHSLFTV